MSNSLKNYNLTVEVSGKGKSKQEAVSDAFRYLSRETGLRIGDEVMVYSRPKEVEILNIEIEEKTERFLFFFLPRKKQEYKITLKVTVDVQTLKV